MDKYFKNFFGNMYEGLKSIKEGMSTFTLFPDTEIPPYSSENTWRRSGGNIKKYGKNVGKHLDDAMEELDKQKLKDNPTKPHH